MTTEIVAEYDVVLCVGDTTFLDYDSIVAKKEGYGPIGKGGNGLILHSALAIEPEKGQSIGLLWQKLWNREPKQKPPKNETPTQKKKRQAAARKEARKRPFEQKESYRWVEALTTVENRVSKSTRMIHAFDREGDITEVFDQVRQLQHTGVLVRAAHNRSLDSDSKRLWSKLEAQPISLEQEIRPLAELFYGKVEGFVMDLLHQCDTNKQSDCPIENLNVWLGYKDGHLKR